MVIHLCIVTPFFTRGGIYDYELIFYHPYHCLQPLLLVWSALHRLLPVHQTCGAQVRAKDTGNLCRLPCHCVLLGIPSTGTVRGTVKLYDPFYTITLAIPVHTAVSHKTILKGDTFYGTKWKKHFIILHPVVWQNFLHWSFVCWCWIFSENPF